MSTYAKKTVIKLLTEQADEKKRQADAILKFHDANTANRKEQAGNLISTMEAQFRQIVKELRQGTLKESERRLANNYKAGTFGKQYEDIKALIGTTPPTQIATERAKEKKLRDLIELVESAEGDYISLADMGRLGVLQFMPVVEKQKAA